MIETEFDRYADDYERLHAQSVAFAGCELGYFAQYKAEYATACFRRYCAENEVLLDFGCGTGTSISYLRACLGNAHLIGADVSQKGLDLAEQRFGAQARFLHIGGTALDLPSDSVGMGFSACVFHHIPPAQHGLWIAELRRVIRPGGVLLIFEHNPFNPLTRHAVASCAFDEDAILLRASTLSERLRAAGWQPQRPRYHVFFPGFLRGLRKLEPGLGWLPIGGQYSVLAIKR